MARAVATGEEGRERAVAAGWGRPGARFSLDLVSGSSESDTEEEELEFDGMAENGAEEEEEEKEEVVEGEEEAEEETALSGEEEEEVVAA